MEFIDYDRRMIEHCVRCGSPAAVRMAFDYQARTVWLDDLVQPIQTGGGYAMCEFHAGRLTPPVGWTLVDRREPDRPLFATLEVA
jgi:hypothetical protein